MHTTADPSTAAQIGGPRDVLTEDKIHAFVRDQLATVDLDGRSVCVIVPDGTAWPADERLALATTCRREHCHLIWVGGDSPD